MPNPYPRIDLVKVVFIYANLLLAFSASSQTKSNKSYLIVRFERLYDNTNQRAFYSINAERGCDQASPIYSLLKYDPKKNADNFKGKFYSITKSAGDSVYNYFLSPTEGLNFIATLQWELVLAFSETSSNYDNQRNSSGELVPITTVVSRPVFCFKK